MIFYRAKTFQETEKEYFNLLCIYIDCHTETTDYKIYSEIYKQLIGDMDLKGWRFSKIKKDIMNHIISNDLILILGLDDYELIKMIMKLMIQCMIFFNLQKFIPIIYSDKNFLYT